MKTMIDMQYSFYMLTHFSVGRIVQDTPASNSDGGLPGDTSVSIIQQHMLIFQKGNISPP
jgi:hypothetical protein